MSSRQEAAYTDARSRYWRVSYGGDSRRSPVTGSVCSAEGRRHARPVVGDAHGPASRRLKYSGVGRVEKVSSARTVQYSAHRRGIVGRGDNGSAGRSSRQHRRVRHAWQAAAAVSVVRAVQIRCREAHQAVRR